jgi:hypothetical protein
MLHDRCSRKQLMGLKNKYIQKIATANPWPGCWRRSCRLHATVAAVWSLILPLRLSLHRTAVAV